MTCQVMTLILRTTLSVIYLIVKYLNYINDKDKCIFQDLIE